jgi:hypothetical protein
MERSRRTFRVEGVMHIQKEDGVNFGHYFTNAMNDIASAKLLSSATVVTGASLKSIAGSEGLAL